MSSPLSSDNGAPQSFVEKHGLMRELKMAVATSFGLDLLAHFLVHDRYASAPRKTRQTATLFAVWSTLGYDAANAERWAAESSAREKTLVMRWQEEHGRPPPPSLMGAMLPGTSREQLHYRSWMSFLAGLCIVRGVTSYRPIIQKQIGVRPVTWAYDVLAGMAGLRALGAALRLGHLEMVRERLKFDLAPDLRRWPY
ncbi:hypothetical protein DL764_006489 [Monosporascus ibericus]|uniref:Uncharacterized protein n=1 Tax=Monosporascus ibericus TaxID=155417 RepID=A0A4Q4T4N8_9PEZI|nr:hypothetical protein DL764_006489 [Monosporascus ibericus]